MTIPKCRCQWEECASWQKTFKEMDHGIWNGTVTVDWKKQTKVDPFQVEAMRSAWDAILGNSDDQTSTYHVARHHFHQPLLLKLEKQQDEWAWTDFYNKKEAKKYLYQVDKQYSVKINQDSVHQNQKSGNY